MNRKTGIILSGIVGVVAGLWVWSAVIPKDSIQIGGSTSVSNVMTNLESAYKTYQENENKNGKDKKVDSFLYSSVGSAGGINSAKSGTYKMGFISKNLDSSVNYVTSKPNLSFTKDTSISDRQKDIVDYLKDSKANSKDDEMHYVQIANDAIVIVYEAPSWFDEDAQKKFEISIDNGDVSSDAQKLMQKIYTGEYKWADLAKDLGVEERKIDKDDKSVVQPFAGAAGSGTRTVFDQTFSLLPDDKLSKEENDIRTKDQTAPSVGPSDGFMYSSINANTIGYLSMNYLSQIKDNKKMHTVIVNGVNPKTDNLIGEDGQIKYGLTRPYIGLIKAKSSDEDLTKLGNFLGWISSAKDNADSDAFKQYKSAGIAPEFKLDDPNLIKDIKKDDSNKKSDDNSSPTNDELKETIMKGYVKEH